MTTIIRYEGRGAIITGGASGIGLKTAERIVAEGGSVSIWDVDAARIETVRQTLGPKAHGIAIDITDPIAVEKAAQTAESQLGRIDVLVCSAGVAGKNELLVNYPIEEWKRVYDINVNGLFYCNRFVAPLMQKHGYGRIVNVASIAGKEGNPTASAYSSSKAAVIGLTKSLGKELSKEGITVNAITPATVDTPILQQVSQAHIDYMLSKIPMGRFGTVEELAAIITWLASEECSFTTGAVFDISGGRATY
ncbi:SDR family NAD(P)-dependent oxidoreductase [Labrys portucalensis]|uniref:SDR family NAD(P)-dependent oxidoreductase n=1 Tax=Labrys neptuniae TaxID=376174 RepID=A0ABV6ZE33_9HYPH